MLSYNPVAIVQEATAAATAAGALWLAQAQARGPKFQVREADILTGAPKGPVLGELLDLCGNAHVQFRDRRSKHYKAFVAAGLVRKTGNGVVEINHGYRMRQEHGLMTACAEAAKAILEKHGVNGLRIWSYID